MSVLRGVCDDYVNRAETGLESYAMLHPNKCTAD